MTYYLVSLDQNLSAHEADLPLAELSSPSYFLVPEAPVSSPRNSILQLMSSQDSTAAQRLSNITRQMATTARFNLIPLAPPDAILGILCDFLDI